MALRVAGCPRCKNPLVFGEVICRSCGQTFQYGANPPPTPTTAQIAEALAAAGVPVPRGTGQPGAPQPSAPQPPAPSSSSWSSPAPQNGTPALQAAAPTPAGRPNPFGGGEIDHGRFEVGDVDVADM